MKENLYGHLIPVHSGGMIGEVKKDGITYGDLPNKYEAGTMATAQVIAFDESIKFLNKIGMENIIKHEKELIEYGQELLFILCYYGLKYAQFLMKRFL